MNTRSHSFIKSVIRLFFSNIMGVMVFSCHSQSGNNQTIDLPYLTATAPSSWRVVQLQGIDSELQAIITDKKDTLILDIGRFSDGLSEGKVPVYPLERKRFHDSLDFHPYRAVYSATPDLDEAQGIYMSEYFLYDTINGKPAKLMIPKRIGQGRMAIHFPQVDQWGNRLTISGHNLDTSQHFAAYRFFKSIRFR